MDGLPKDVTQLILKKLSLVTLGRLCCVCTFLRHWVESLPEWKTVFGDPSRVQEERQKRFEKYALAPGIRPIRLTLIGPPGCGKTTTIIVYTTNAVPQEYFPPGGEVYDAHVMVGSQHVQLSVQDGSNLENLTLTELRDVWQPSDGFCVCYDRQDAAKSCRAALRYLELAERVCGERDLAKILVGIKKPDAETEAEEEAIMAGKASKAKDYTYVFRTAYGMRWMRVGTYQKGLKAMFDEGIREAMLGGNRPTKAAGKCQLM